MPRKSPEVDAYLKAAASWRRELTRLRAIALDCQLAEEWKWRQPCYCYEGANVAILGGFKDYCAISFFKGALLKDPAGLLAKPGENTRAARLIRFTSLDEIDERATIVAAYLYEAIALEQAGAKVDLSVGAELDFPAELQGRLQGDPALHAAFDALTPGRRRAYLLHFSSAKQSKTRQTRIEECVPKILRGQGLHDCTCGLSQRMPSCDGSHKSLG